MKESLDQQRACFAWDKIGKLSAHTEEYSKLAKGAPALIMTSGLMPVLAFYREKGKDKDGKSKTHHDYLLEHLCDWLHMQFEKRISNAKFDTVMSALMGSDDGNAAEHAHFYQRTTAESMAILRWIRHFSDVIAKSTDQAARGQTS
jgi:CRISPR-associated protein Cmr5